MIYFARAALSNRVKIDWGQPNDNQLRKVIGPDRKGGDRAADFGHGLLDEESYKVADRTLYNLFPSCRPDCDCPDPKVL